MVSIVERRDITRQEVFYRYDLHESGRVAVSRRLRARAGVADVVVRPEVIYSRGQLAGQVVRLTEYNTPSNSKSRELTEREIQWLNTYRGPNIAKYHARLVVLDGLRGVVSSMGQLSSDIFLQRTGDAAVLVEFLKGIRAVMRYRDTSKSFSEVQVSVDYSGRVTASAPLTNEGFHLTPCCVLKLPFPKETYHPAITATITAYMNGNLWDSDTNETFLEAIRTGDFTPLAVLAAAKETGAVPWTGGGECYRNAPPPVMYPRDFFLEYENEGAYDYRPVHSYSTGPVNHQLISPHSTTYYCGDREDGWKSYNISLQPKRFQYYLEDQGSIHQDTSDIVPEWAAFCNQAEELAENLGIDMGSLQLCANVMMTITLKNNNPSEDYLPYHVYFHRHPGMRSNPRNFWGFMSASPDPEAESVLLEELGWETQYNIYFDKYSMSRDYGYLYKRGVVEGLASIPGSFLNK